MCLNLKEYYFTNINTHHTLHRHQPRQACSSHHQIVIWICFWQTQPIYKYWDGNAVYTNLVGGRELKLRLILVIQCSRGSSRFLRRPWSTDRTLGLWTLEVFFGYKHISRVTRARNRTRRATMRTKWNLWTSWRTKRWEQQQAETVIWMVFRPAWHTCKT